MALGTIQDPSGLSQGAETVVSDMVFGTPTGNQVTVTSVGTGLPLLVDNEYIEIRDHTQALNNGLYRVNDASPSTGSVTLDKISGNPVSAGTTSASTFSSIRNAETVTFENVSGSNADIKGTGLPVLVVGSRFVIELAAQANNNGPWEVTVVNTSTSDYTCKKLNTSAPVEDLTPDAVTMITDVKSVMYDTAALGIYVLEQPTAIAALDLDGVLGQAFYSFTVISWKDDPFLIANAPFPMLTIDSDAGKYLIGQDPSGNNSGWATVDVTGEAIRTTKMFRNMGWSEYNSAGTIDKEYSGIRTLGAFLDETPGTGDTAYYHFGDDATVDDSTSFTFAGPVNEAILVYDANVTPPDTVTLGFVITTNNTITRNDGGNWRTDGYIVGGQIVIFDAEDPANDGTYEIASVADATNGALTVVGTPLTNNADDTTIHFGIDNRNAITLKLRVRTTAGDTNARTYAQANLAAAGETILSNRLFTFGLSNSQDLNITALDANIDADAPYSAGGPSGTMSVTYHATPQSKGGSGDLVGGPYNFGIVIDGNGGTNTQVYEWVQRQLRRDTAVAVLDGSTKIGLMLDGLMRFLGPTLQVGSTDGGLTFPVNPDGGGSGVFIDNLNSASRNDTVYYDNTGTLRAHPLGVPLTLDFTQTALDDSAFTYTLFFDYTIRTTVGDLVINAGTGPTGTFTSAGSNLPAALDAGVGAYVRISGLTGADAPMNGIYQVTSISAASYNVTRYDGATIVTTTVASLSLDQHPVNSPDAIIVQDNVPTNITGVDPSADPTFTFDYSGNTQGGRSASTDAAVVLRAIGQNGAQYGAATATITSSATTIPITNQIERNFLNP